jgi:isopentenyldiphosphate isomerase
MDQEELFPIVDEEGNVVGRALRTECHDGRSFILHPVVHLYVFNSKGELYLQKRSLSKKIQPGKWDTSVGGHVDYGEVIEEALRREAREELGIVGFEPVFMKRYVFQSSAERELVYVYKCFYDGNIFPDGDEISEGRFWNLDEIAECLDSDMLTRNFREEFPILFLELI